MWNRIKFFVIFPFLLILSSCGEKQAAVEASGYVLLPSGEDLIWCDLDFGYAVSLPLDFQQTWAIMVEPANYSGTDNLELTPVSEGAGRTLYLTADLDGDEPGSNLLLFTAQQSVSAISGLSENAMYQSLTTDSGLPMERWTLQQDGRVQEVVLLSGLNGIRISLNFSEAAYEEYEESILNLYRSVRTLTEKETAVLGQSIDLFREQ